MGAVRRLDHSVHAGFEQEPARKRLPTGGSHIHGGQICTTAGGRQGRSAKARPSIMPSMRRPNIESWFSDKGVGAKGSQWSKQDLGLEVYQEHNETRPWTPSGRASVDHGVCPSTGVATAAAATPSLICCWCALPGPQGQCETRGSGCAFDSCPGFRGILIPGCSLPRVPTGRKHQESVSIHSGFLMGREPQAGHCQFL